MVSIIPARPRPEPALAIFDSSPSSMHLWQSDLPIIESGRLSSAKPIEKPNPKAPVSAVTKIRVYISPIKAVTKPIIPIIIPGIFLPRLLERWGAG